MDKRAVFLDRDGTLVEEANYLRRVEDMVVYPFAAEAVRLINRSGFLAVVATNQSAIGRGFLDETQLTELHCALNEALRASGAAIDAFYFCPHHPEAPLEKYRRRCSCRKPEAGLLLEAARDLGLSLTESYCIGDRLSDIEAGRRVGCRSVLVRTGYGAIEASLLDSSAGAQAGSAELLPDFVAADVLEAVKWVLVDRGHAD
jgi:histidinol-phosphate phosphatase family protein